MNNPKRDIESLTYIKGNSYLEILERLNLQSIGYFMKGGSRLLKVDETSFSERDQIAQTELEKELYNQLGEETANTLLPAIIKYASKKEEIQFSIGMKTGAKLALLLTTDFEHDF